MTTTLLCLPAAGAGRTAFRRWPECAPDGLEVTALAPPGRDGDRRAPASSVDAVVDTLVGDLAGGPPGPGSCAVFGHSLGAVLGFELTRRLAGAADLPTSVLLVVCASAAPDRAAGGRRDHELPDDEFAAAVERLGGVPPGALDDPDLRELLLPPLRADFTAAETYRPAAGATVGVPVLALSGDDDPTVSDEDVGAWAHHTTGSFRHRRLHGGHFLLDEAREEILAEIGAGLAAVREGTT